MTRLLMPINGVLGRRITTEHIPEHALPMAVLNRRKIRIVIQMVNQDIAANAVMTGIDLKHL